MSWQEIRRKHIRAVPRGSPFSAYQRALEAASAEYRGRTAASNPSGADVKRLAVLGLALLVAAQILKPKAGG